MCVYDVVCGGGGFVRACVPVCVYVACLLALVRASYEALKRAYRLCLNAFFLKGV